MVKIISKRTISNRLVSKFLDIPNTTLNLLCQTGKIGAEAKPGRGKKRALTFGDVLTLRIAMALRRISAQALGSDVEIMTAAKNLAERALWTVRAGLNVLHAGVIKFGYKTVEITMEQVGWLKGQDKELIEISKYMEKPYCAVTFFLLQPLFDDVVDMFEAVEKAHEWKAAARAAAAKEKNKLKKEINTKP